MKRTINPNFKHLVKLYKYNRENLNEPHHAVLEGSSRSGKTYSAILFLIYYCLKEQNKTIFIIRQTYASHKTTTYDTFGKVLSSLNMVNPFLDAKDVTIMRIGTNTIHFLGADKSSKFEGANSDIAYFNEILDIPQEIFDSVEQRCQGFIIADFNPKFSQHWVYDKVMKREDMSYLHSTYVVNKFISPTELKKILSYDPTNPKNIEQGTADDYRWNVYGLGLRKPPEGLIFNNIEWIDEFPSDIQNVFFGLDFGFTVDPTALVRIGLVGNDLFLKKEIYTPFQDSGELYEVCKDIIKQAVVYADRSDKYQGQGIGFVSDLRRIGLNIYPVRKWAGSVNYGIDLMKRHKLHIVKSKEFITEAENYCYMSINGIQIDKPIDAFNHLWDASRYGVQNECRP